MACRQPWRSQERKHSRRKECRRGTENGFTVEALRSGSRKNFLSSVPGCFVGFETSPPLVAAALGGSRSPLRPHPTTAKPMTASTTVRRMILRHVDLHRNPLGQQTRKRVLHSEVPRLVHLIVRLWFSAICSVAGAPEGDLLAHFRRRRTAVALAAGDRSFDRSERRKSWR